MTEQFQALALALDLWVGVEFWLPAALLILVSLMVVGAPTAQLRTSSLGAVFVLVAIFAILAQQWLIALVAMLYAWVLVRQANQKAPIPVHILKPSIPRPWRALALISSAIFVGIWLLAVKRTAVWRFAETELNCSLNNVLASLPTHGLTLILLATALLVSWRWGTSPSSASVATGGSGIDAISTESKS